ncbi:MAG: hypothetical protein CVU65_01170 [Deltaproteobacteria bacterium HGW-Deltaproteobacteria-22]|jgi:geranylgeranyl pyrophosphate synthase|nr:MAG: hypothetical protein CVU65_01170 [Deltaproteobacteria bacterium HGW-Deltaproteobacteria-22]
MTGFPDPTYAALAARFERFLPATLERIPPGLLREAVAHVLLGGGKRFRPVLCLAAAGIDPGAPPEDDGREPALFAAAALEWMHTYSLVHDDLPALDDDDWRRGRPTLHKKYGEATAILAGDALHAGALVLAAGAPCGSEQRAGLCALLAGASLAMVQGQMLDTIPLAMKGGTAGDAGPSVEGILEMIDGKTGAMIATSLRMGAVLAGTGNHPGWPAFGRLLGRCFQLRDDLLDVTGSLPELGKTPGKDARQDKSNLVSLTGVGDATAMLDQLRSQAYLVTDTLPGDRAFFRALVAYVVDRTA